MAAAYRVTAPYVVLKVRDPMSGSEMVNGFYKDAIVTDDRVNKQQLQRHIDRGWVEKVPEPKPEPKQATKSDGGDDPSKVPDGTADEVKAWVGDSSERAALALAAEQASTKPRTTLVDQLTKLANPA